MQTKDAERYATFWAQFGRALKEGLLEDPDNTRGPAGARRRSPPPTTRRRPTTLREYVERMKDGQDAIYYLTGETRAMVENSPHMEAFAAKGYEVLILTDPVDEVWVDRVPAFDGNRFSPSPRARSISTRRPTATGRPSREGTARAGLRRAAAVDDHRPVRAGQAGPAVLPPDDLGGVHRRRHPRRDTDAGEDVPGDGTADPAGQADPGAQPRRTRSSPPCAPRTRRTPTIPRWRRPPS